MQNSNSNGDHAYPKKIGEIEWLIEIREPHGSSERLITLDPNTLDQMGWHDMVDESNDSQHNDSVANEA